VSVVVGGLLLLGGVAAAAVQFDLPFRGLRDDFLTPQLGRMAGMFLGLVCGSLAVYHGLGSILNRRSRPLRLPPFYVFWILFALVLGLGNLLFSFKVAIEYLFPPLFLLGAALPTVAVLAWAGRRLGWPATWRQSALSLVTGSTLSVWVTLLLGSILPFLAYILILPLEIALYSVWGTPLFLLDPEALFFILFTALQAPIPEEFAKALGPGIMNRSLGSERQAFCVGLAAGAGFAILENMLYEGLYAQWSGWSWGGITLLRGFGSILHPLCTALVALALFRARGRPEGWFRQLARAYLLSVGLHTLWNGGFELLVYFTGFSLYTGQSLEFYGEAVSLMLIIYLVLLSVGLWWLLRRTVLGLAESDEVTAVAAPAPQVPARSIAIWAFACALVIIPIGAAMGPAWNQVRSLIFGSS